MMCGRGLKSVGRALLLVLLLSLVSVSAFTQEDVETMTTMELIDEALILLEEQGKRLDEREASLTQRETNLNTIEQSLTRIETVAADFEQYSKSLEDENASLQTWNNILIGTTVTGLVTSMLLLMLR